MAVHAQLQLKCFGTSKEKSKLLERLLPKPWVLLNYVCHHGREIKCFQQSLGVAWQNCIRIMLQVSIFSCESGSYADKLSCACCRMVRKHHCSGGPNRLFRRDRQSRRGGGVALCAREKLDFTALTLRDDAVESLMVRSWGMENKENVLVGVSYQSLLSRVSWA